MVEAPLVWDGERFLTIRYSTPDHALVMAFGPMQTDRNGYPFTPRWNAKEKRQVILYIHRVIARAPAGWQADHVNHDLLDVRRRSLRLATPSQNSANTRRFKKHSSRYRGVTWHKAVGKWQAAVKHRDVCHYLGLFATEEAAARAYDDKARSIFGPFAILNNLPSQKPVTGRAA